MRKFDKNKHLEEMRKYVDLESPNGETIEARYNSAGNIVQRHSMQGLGWKCSCTGTTKETATDFETTPEGLVCPKCGKTLKTIKTKEEYSTEVDERLRKEAEKEREAQENVHLCFVDQSVSSGLQYYELSTRVEYDTWKKIKDLFFYMSYDEDDEEQDTFGMTRLTGWLTTQPGKVEERLNVKPELRLEYRRKEAEKRKKARDELNKEKAELKEKIFAAFKPENTVQPWADETKKGTQGSSMIKYPAGEELEDPKYPFDIYGGGRSISILI